MKQRSTKDERQRQKKAYLRPEVRQVELRPEEAVLGICKASGTGGPAQSQCTSPSNCSSTGS